MIRVKDLPDPADQTIHNVYYKGPSLYCTICGGEYSANRGDYFIANPETVMKCCGLALKLVRKECRRIEVGREEGSPEWRRLRR